MRIRTFGVACLLSLLLAGVPAPARPQTGPRIIDTGRLDQTPGPDLQRARVAAYPNPKAPADIARQSLVLRQIRLVGPPILPLAALQSIWRPQINHRITVQDVFGIADAIGAAYADAGLALYQVEVPRQSFTDGMAMIRVVEGRVADVVIQGDVDGADLSLLKRYAARIVADRPLRRATLEREILLMNRIAGLKVGSRFEPLPGDPGGLRLLLNVQRRRFEGLAGFNKQGTSVLGRTQLYVGAAANSLLQEGDRTEFVFGFPGSFTHYQYYGLTHITPLGNNGATLTANLGYLATRPVGSTLAGNAVVTGLTLGYPIILSTREALAGTVTFNLLDSNNALLGTTISDERTRALRADISYARDDDWKGTSTIGLTGSEGLDVFGARRGGPAFGGPAFIKLNLHASRDQKLPLDFVVRARAAAQYAPTHLPASEQFVYGGLDYGQAFYANPLYGDRGLKAYTELAYPLSQLSFSNQVSGSEVFAFADWGETWNVHTIYQVATDHAASAGIGMRTKLFGKLSVQVVAANALLEPQSVSKAARWDAMFAFVGAF